MTSKIEYLTDWYTVEEIAIAAIFAALGKDDSIISAKLDKTAEMAREKAREINTSGNEQIAKFMNIIADQAQKYSDLIIKANMYETASPDTEF